MRKLCQCRPVSENNHNLQSNTHPSGTSGSNLWRFHAPTGF
jgi:hypothetical protein